LREEKVRIVIMPDGTSTVEVLGVKGKRCLKITEELEEELKKKVRHLDFTAAWTDGDILEDLRVLGLKPDTAKKLLKVYPEWKGEDLESFWEFLHGILDEEEIEWVDPWHVYEALNGQGGFL